MTECLHCKAAADRYLCKDCTTQLTDMLTQIPWLLDELDARIERLDRVSTGTIGRTRRADEINVIDFDAAELARKIRKKLLTWVETVAQRHTGRTPPALGTVTTKNLARWLAANTGPITLLNIAGKLYRDIDHLVGTTERGGQLVTAINRTDRGYFGPCSTIVGRNRDGTPRECGHDLYAPRDSTEVHCPRCKTDKPAKKQLLATITERDLVTEPKLLETMDTLGEHLSRPKLYEWIRTGQLKPRGYLHAGNVVPQKIRHKDPRVFSLSQARQLRWRDVEHCLAEQGATR
jgi:hypothetical protein